MISYMRTHPTASLAALVPTTPPPIITNACSRHARVRHPSRNTKASAHIPRIVSANLNGHAPEIQTSEVSSGKLRRPISKFVVGQPERCRRRSSEMIFFSGGAVKIVKSTDIRASGDNQVQSALSLSSTMSAVAQESSADR